MKSTFIFEERSMDLVANTLRPTALARCFKIDESSMMLVDDNGETYLPNGDTFSPVLDSGKIYIIYVYIHIGYMTSEKSEFKFGGITKRHNALTLKSSLLALVFQLVKSTIVLVDEAGNTYMPSDDGFEPSLENGKSYTVKGERVGETSKDIIARRGEQVVQPHGTLANQSIHAVVPAEGQIAQASNSQQIALMPQKKIDQTLNNIISACRGMNDNLSMLYSGTRTVCLMESLAVLASCGTDVSLVTEQMPVNRFQLLKNPHSFRASIYQLLASISDAFRVSNTCMGTIKAALSDIPDNFSDIIEMLAAQSESDLEIIKDTFTSITDSADKCIQMAAKVEKPLDHVLQIIDELCHASVGAKGVNEKMKLELQKLMEQMAIAKRAKEEETMRVEQDRVEAMRKVEQARNEYWNQLKKDAPPPTIVKSSFFFGFIKNERVDNSALHAHQQQTVQLKDEFDRESRYEEELKRSMEQSHRELTDFMCKLKNMDTRSADLASIVSLLQEGIALLSRIRGEWMMLCNFFEKVKIVLNEYLLKSITNFKKFAQKEKVQYMLREALKTVCLCVQISNAADIYTMIMDRQVIPELSKVGKELALTEHEAKSKLNELEGRYYAKEHQVTELIEAKIREFNERAQEQMQEYATDLVEAHKTGFAQRALNF